MRSVRALLWIKRSVADDQTGNRITAYSPKTQAVEFTVES